MEGNEMAIEASQQIKLWHEIIDAEAQAFIAGRHPGIREIRTAGPSGEPRQRPNQVRIR
jgi:hypothetical protein